MKGRVVKEDYVHDREVAEIERRDFWEYNTRLAEEQRRRRLQREILADDKFVTKDSENAAARMKRMEAAEAKELVEMAQQMAQQTMQQPQMQEGIPNEQAN